MIIGIELLCRTCRRQQRRGSAEGDFMMPRCCMESFVLAGVATGFELAEEGDIHICGTCGRKYKLIDGQWEYVDA